MSVSSREAAGSISTNAGRRIQLLQAVLDAEASGRPGAGVVAVAEMTARERSQVSRGLALLEAAGLLTRDERTLEYASSAAALQLCAAAGRPDLVIAARPLLSELSSELGERATLEVPSGHDSMVVATVSSGEPVEAVAWVGRTSPRWCTAAGRASLFDHDAADVRSLLRGVELVAGPLAPRSIAEVLRRLDADRARGVAVAIGELEDGLVSLAAPIRDATGMVGVITVAGPSYRLGEHVDAAASIVRGAADQVTAALCDAGE